jgi:hypothetical protein
VSRFAFALAVLVSTALAAPGAAGAKVLLSADEALALAFPGCAIERRTVFLSQAQRARAAELAGTELATARVHPYVATRSETGGATCGTAYFDTHRVRTLAETLMVAIAPDGTILRVEVLAFDEPLDYLPRPVWYESFRGRALDAELELRRSVRPVSGATLTARATTDGARRALALHRALDESAPPPAAPAPASEGSEPR